MTSQRHIVRAFALRAISILAVLVLMELGLRLFLASPFHMVRDDHLGLKGRPHATVIQSREGYARNRLNHEGLADREPNPNASERILVVGDSYTEALNVPLKDNLTSVAEALLPGAEIINGGVSGRSPVQSVVAAREYARHAPLDAIVLQVSEGDPEEMFRTDRLFLRRNEEGDWEQVVPEALTRRTPAGRLKLWMISHSSLVNLVVRRVELLEAQERKRLAHKLGGEAVVSATTLPKREEVLEKAASAMDFLMAELRQLSPRVILLVMPTLDYEAPGLPLVRPDRVDFWDEYARSRGIPFVDPSEALREDFYRSKIPGNGFQNSVLGEGHLNRRGHAVVGRCLASTLQKILVESDHKGKRGPTG